MCHALGGENMSGGATHLWTFFPIYQYNPGTLQLTPITLTTTDATQKNLKTVSWCMELFKDEENSTGT